MLFKFESPELNRKTGKGRKTTMSIFWLKAQIRDWNNLEMEVGHLLNVMTCNSSLNRISNLESACNNQGWRKLGNLVMHFILIISWSDLLLEWYVWDLGFFLFFHYLQRRSPSGMVEIRAFNIQAFFLLGHNSTLYFYRTSTMFQDRRPLWVHKPGAEQKYVPLSRYN